MSSRFAIVSLVIGAAVSGAVFGATLLDSAPFTRAATTEQTPQPTGRAAQAGVGLPDLTAVAERALQASVNISSTQYVRLDPFQQFFQTSYKFEVVFSSFNFSSFLLILSFKA